MPPKLRDRPHRATVVEEVEEGGDTVMSDSPRPPRGQATEQEATSVSSESHPLALQPSPPHSQTVVPSSHGLQPLAAAPALDFGAITAKLPGTLHVDQLQINLTQQQLYHNDAAMAALQREAQERGM